MPEPLAEDQVTLLVWDLRPLDLPTRVRKRERRQVLAGEEGRDVGRREVKAVGVEMHAEKNRRRGGRRLRAQLDEAGRCEISVEGERLAEQVSRPCGPGYLIYLI